MRFYWTAEDVSELMGKLEPHAQDDLVSVHSATLRTHLRRTETMKPGIRREQEWKLVEAEARKLQAWLDGQAEASTP